MRNLKRVLSLALAAMMLIGMMVVGASAASYNDFTDKDEIVNKDAVSMLVTLGVINGMEDGSYFAPTEGVDRAQMAKMISVIMNQGVDKGDLYEKTPTGLTDVKDHWAEGHINFCYTTGIIAGRGNNTYDPDAGVTGTEAAKMLLVAAGYDPAVEGLTGAQWEIKTIALASKLGIFRNYTKPVTNALSRDDAALLIYNALDVEMIQKYEDGYAVAHDDHRTILSAMYGVYKVEGVVTANEWAQLQETDSDAALRTGKTTLDDVIVYSSTTANTTTGEGVRETAPVTFNVSTPVDMLGKTVTLYIEKTTILSNSKVLGVATKDDVNVIQATTATEETLADYLKGTGVAVNSSTEYYVNYGFGENGEDEAISIINEHPNRDLGERNEYFNVNGVSVEVIDNDDDGVAEYVLYVQETLSEVSRYNDKNEILTFYVPERDNTGALTGDAVTLSRDFEDVVFNDNVTTDDLVLYVEYGGRTYVSLAPIETGVMTRVDRDKDNEMYITVNGETFKQSYIPDAASMSDVDLTHFDIDTARADVGFDDEYDFILDSTGKYIVAFRPTEEVVTNYALVLGSAWTQNALDKSGQVKILKADGNVATYDINWSKSDDAFAGVASINGSFRYDSNGDGAITAVDAAVTTLSSEQKLELYLGSRDVWAGTNIYGVNAAEGSIITYTLSDDDVLTIESVMQGNTFAANANQAATALDIDNSNAPRTTAGVGDNGVVLYLGSNPNNDNLQYNVAGAGYENGSGSITVSGVDNDNVNYPSTQDLSGVTKTYAVDLNTVGFYYWVEGGDTHYGVATGWDDMSDVAAGTDAQVYPVLEKTTNRTYEATNLAEVILFEATNATDSTDYMLVLDANAATKDTWELSVVFEDGTVAAIVVDEDDLGDFEVDNDASFMRAWSYSKNSDGTYKVGSMYRGQDTVPAVAGDDESTARGTAYLLKTGTVDFTEEVNDTNSYVALSGKANVWDVTDVDDANDSTVMGSFSKTVVNTVMVFNNDGSIRTAWIWDIPQTVDPDDEIEGDFTFDTLVPELNNNKIEFADVDTDDVFNGSSVNGWQLNDLVITYTISKDGASANSFKQTIAQAAFADLENQMSISGYSINANSTGRYEISVLVQFTGDDGHNYTISGDCVLVID